MPGPLRLPGRLARAVLICACAAFAAGAVAACDSSESRSGDVTAALGARTGSDAPEGFPHPHGQSLRAFAASLPQGPVLHPAVSLLERGPNRVAFVLYDAGRQEITADAVAVYTVARDGTTVTGPFKAWRESLQVPSEVRSRTTAEDPDAPTGFYVAKVPFAREGAQTVIAVARLDHRLVASKPTQLTVGGDRPTPPERGDRAPRVHTLTSADVGGDLAVIDTRVPPTTMHEVDLADVLGKRPVVAVFATPGLCRTRVCAPVTDVAEAVHRELSDRAAFVHMEIYEGNEMARGVRDHVRAYRLPSEPWTFVIDERGRVSQRFEGPLSARELRAAVRRVSGE